MNTATKIKLPTIKAVRSLLIDLKPTIADDYRCTDDPEDITPGMLVTIGADPEGNWGWQTGDNSFSGGAYGYPHWGLAYLHRRSNCTDLAREVIGEISEAQSY